MAAKPEVILLDEPCSALDPISTAKIEELIDELSNDYTIAIVTHNMQQASRTSDFTAFMYLGELVEFGQTEKLFTAPDNKRTENTSPAASAEGLPELCLLLHHSGAWISFCPSEYRTSASRTAADGS